MSIKTSSRYLAASAFALGTLLSVTSASAQGGPISMFQDLIGEWNNTSSGATGGYSIFVRRNGDVLQQGAPMARVADTIRAGANFAFEGSYPPPDNRIFRCTYYITFLAGIVIFFATTPSYSLMLGLSPTLRTVLTLPLVSLALSAFGTRRMVQALRTRSVGVGARAADGLFMTHTVAFFVFLNHWNLLGYRG